MSEVLDSIAPVAYYRHEPFSASELAAIGGGVFSDVIDPQARMAHVEFATQKTAKLVNEFLNGQSPNTIGLNNGKIESKDNWVEVAVRSGSFNKTILFTEIALRQQTHPEDIFTKRVSAKAEEIALRYLTRYENQQDPQTLRQTANAKTLLKQVALFSLYQGFIGEHSQISYQGQKRVERALKKLTEVAERLQNAQDADPVEAVVRAIVSDSEFFTDSPTTTIKRAREWLLGRFQATANRREATPQQETTRQIIANLSPARTDSIRPIGERREVLPGPSVKELELAGALVGVFENLLTTGSLRESLMGSAEMFIRDAADKGEQQYQIVQESLDSLRRSGQEEIADNILFAVALGLVAGSNGRRIDIGKGWTISFTVRHIDSGIDSRKWKTVVIDHVTPDEYKGEERPRHTFMMLQATTNKDGVPSTSGNCQVTVSTYIERAGQETNRSLKGLKAKDSAMALLKEFQESFS